MSRSRNSQLNAFFGFTSQCLNMILQFINRSIFIKTLGAEYLGLSGLFTNILSMLSLAELGIGSAIMFNLYKPIADNDKRKIKALMNLYRKAYIIIGIVIFTIGILLIPFLKYIVNFNESIDINYTLIYLMFLANSVISYLFFAYRSVIIEANQQMYLITKINTVIQFIITFIQIITLMILKNYYIYLAIPIILVIVKNIIISRKAGKLFPIINEKNNEKLSTKEKKEIFKNIYALSLTKISYVVYSSTDNIIISIILGIKYVGIYSNYLLITTCITTFINILFNSFKASIGNLYVTESKEKQFDVFKKILFINFWIYGLSSICLWQLLNPFIKIWIGEGYLLEPKVVLLIALMFLITGLNHTITIFKDSCGLFWETRYRTLLTAIINLIASIVLVKYLGISGVFLGTILAYLTTIYLIDPRVVFNKVFFKSSKFYYVWCIKSFIIICFTGIIVDKINSIVELNYKDIFISKTLICLVVINLTFVVFFRKSKEFNYYIIFIKEKLKLVNKKIYNKYY